MFISYFKHNKSLRVLFGVVSVLFFLLATIDFRGLGLLQTVVGYLGLFLGATAIYAYFYQIINEDWKNRFSNYKL